jgi:hypothetical protein
MPQSEPASDRTGHSRLPSRVQALTAAFEQQSFIDDTDKPPLVMDLKSSSSYTPVHNSIGGADNGATCSVHTAATAHDIHVQQPTSPKAAPNFLNKLRIFGGRK